MRKSSFFATLFVLVFLNQTSYAEHSLAAAVSFFPELKKTVDKILSTNNVVCDLDDSLQMEAFPSGGSLGAWRQIAFCYPDLQALAIARDYLSRREPGRVAGLYGTPGVVGVLDVSYRLPSQQRVGRVLKAALR
jgi:hypothetical protein